MRKAIKILGVSVGAILVLVVLSRTGGSMSELKHEIKINAPKDQVFSTLANLELVQEYNPGVVSAKYITSTHNGVGAARECDLGKEGIVREKVTGFEEGNFITMELYQHNWPLEFMHWTTQIQTEGNATLVSQTLQYKVKFGILGSLLDKLVMKNKLDSTLNAVFQSMKNYVER